MKIRNFTVSLILLLAMLFTLGDSQAGKLFIRTATTGDTAYSLDGIAVGAISDGDSAIVNLGGATLTTCFYVLDDDANQSTSGESPCPRYVQPATTPGTNSWVLNKVNGYEIAGIVQLKEQIFFTNGSWNCDLDNDGSCTDTNEASWDMGLNYLQFPQTTDSGTESLIVKLPEYFDETDDEVVITIYWHSAQTDDTKTVIWCPNYQKCSGNDCTWSGYTEDCLAADNPSLTANDIIETSETVTNAHVDGWSAGDLIMIKLIRNADTDTMAGDALLDGVELTFDRSW